MARKKYSETERFAYQMARVKEGLKNPDSKVSESFANGKKSAQQSKPAKKSLL